MNSKTLILSLSVAIGLAYVSQKNKSIYSKQQRTTHFPSQIIKALSLDHKVTLGGLFWIDAIMDFGDQTYGNPSPTFNSLETKLERVSALNPKLRQIYIAIGVLDLALPDSAKQKKLQLGQQTFPDDWEIALYYSYFLAQKNNFSKAYQIMLPFSQRENIPKHIQNLASSYKKNLLPKKEALLSYLVEYTKTKDKWRQRAICQKISKLLSKNINKTCETLNSNQNLNFKYKALLSHL